MASPIGSSAVVRRHGRRGLACNVPVRKLRAAPVPRSSCAGRTPQVRPPISIKCLSVYVLRVGCVHAWTAHLPSLHEQSHQGRCALCPVPLHTPITADATGAPLVAVEGDIVTLHFAAKSPDGEVMIWEG